MSRLDRTITLPHEALVIPLLGEVLLPGSIGAVQVTQPGVVKAIEALGERGYPLVLVPVRDPERSRPSRANLRDVGCLGRILKGLRFPDGSFRVLAESLARVRLGRISRRSPAIHVFLSPMEDTAGDEAAVRAAATALRDSFHAYFALSPQLPPELEPLVPPADQPERLADYIMGNLAIETAEAVEFLETPDLQRRLRQVLDVVEQRRAVMALQSEVHARVQTAMDRQQREYYLKEQLSVIRSELGELAPGEGDVDLLMARVARSGMPDGVRQEVEREIERMGRMHPDAAEYGVARTYVDWLLQMPWRKTTRDRADLQRVERILDRDHAGLESVKERIAEFLAVRQLKSDMKGPILCFMGPPGVGKTSLGRSIARALGRRFERISLGGVKDESEIRGHRRTYIGAMPGRIIQSVKRAGSLNPVLMLDEIDKVGADFRGDPASALLEALDPEQNHTFTDHYLDVPFDLSQVMFLLTANVSETIPSALHDRLEIIELPGYTEEEKLEICRAHLIRKQIKAHGLGARQIRFRDEAVAGIIRGYTMEAGVRGLERELARCCRKVARRIVRGEARRVVVDLDSLDELLGPRRFTPDIAERTDIPGVAIGLAWTPSGGEILFIEATQMPGGKHFRVTGQLGDVMKESAEAALSYIRANADQLGVDPRFWTRVDLHIHVPAGATPKDGPSAGIALTIALVSLLTGRRVRGNLAMTGEITLRGKVLPVGGIKEKVLAARRAGIEEVVLPAANRKDLQDVPEALRDRMTYAFVERIGQVIDIAFDDDRGEMPPSPGA